MSLEPVGVPDDVVFEEELPVDDPGSLASVNDIPDNVVTDIDGNSGSVSIDNVLSVGSYELVYEEFIDRSGVDVSIGYSDTVSELTVVTGYVKGFFRHPKLDIMVDGNVVVHRFGGREDEDGAITATGSAIVPPDTKYEVDGFIDSATSDGEHKLFELKLR